MPLGNATSYLQNIFLLNIFLKIPEMIDHSKSKNIFRAVEKYSLVPSPRARVDGDPDGAELSEPLLRGDLDPVIEDGDP